MEKKQFKIEFISEKKVVKEMSYLEDAVEFAKKLKLARVKNQDNLESIWGNVGKLLKVDPFLPLSFRVKSLKTNKIISSPSGKRLVFSIWGNTV